MSLPMYFNIRRSTHPPSLSVIIHLPLIVSLISLPLYPFYYLASIYIAILFIYLYLRTPPSHFTLPPSPSLIIHHLLTVALRGRVSDAAGARRRLLRRDLLPGGAARPLQEAGRVCQILREWFLVSGEATWSEGKKDASDGVKGELRGSSGFPLTLSHFSCSMSYFFYSTSPAASLHIFVLLL